MASESDASVRICATSRADGDDPIDAAATEDAFARCELVWEGHAHTEARCLTDVFTSSRAKSDL